MTIPHSLHEDQKRQPIAPWWHTTLLAVILVGIALRGAMFQAASAGSAQPHDALPLYIALVISELVLVYAVAMGIRRTRTTLTDLIGGRWNTGRDVAGDAVRGIGLWAILTAVAGAWDHWVPVVGHVRSISPLLPQGAIEMGVWIVVSLAGGVAEEIVFRGYFQRQFEALTQNPWIAVALQAVLFGVSHGYQGVNACIKITLIGALFGLLARWRRSLRPGMIAHVWTDIASGLFHI